MTLVVDVPWNSIPSHIGGKALVRKNIQTVAKFDNNIKFIHVLHVGSN